LQKNKKFSANAVLVLAMLMILGGTISMSDDGGKQTPPDTCNDGLDNDGDGQTDGQDSECGQGSPFYDGDEDGSNGGNNPPLKE